MSIAIDKLAGLSKSSLAEPCDSKGFPVEFNEDRMAILMAYSDPHRRWKHGRNCNPDPMGDVTLGHATRRTVILRKLSYLTPALRIAGSRLMEPSVLLTLRHPDERA